MTAIVLSEESKISSGKIISISCIHNMKGNVLEPKSPSAHQEKKINKKGLPLASSRGKKHTRTSSLHLRDILLPQPKLFIDSKHILSDRQRGHSIRVMWHTSDSLCALSGGERLPPSLGATTASVHYRKVIVQRYATSMKDCREALTGSPVHHISCPLFQPTQNQP
jgi:hypothetical protein